MTTWSFHPGKQGAQTEIDFMMNYYVLIPLLALIFNVAITSYVVAQRRTPINRDYILLSSFFIGWIFFDIIHWSPINNDWVVPLLRLQAAFWLPIGFLLTKFTYTLLGRHKDTIYYTILAAALIAVLLGVGTDLVITNFKREHWGVLIVGGILYVPFTLLVTTVPFVYALVLIFNAMRKTGERNIRRQMAMIVAGTGLAVVASASTLIILPEFFGIRPLPLHHFGIVIHLGFIVYAILKYRFLIFDIHDIADDLFSNVHDGVVVLNKHSDILQANPATKKLFGESSDEKVLDSVNKLLQDYQPHSIIDEHETILDSPKGQRNLRISRFPVKHSNEEIGAIIFLHDITKHKQAAEKIEIINRDLATARDQALEASHTKSAFLANISHELRTPLNAIIGFSEILMGHEELKEKEEIIDDLGSIHTSGYHLLELINQVLDLSKVEAGKMETYNQDVVISELMESIVDTIQPLIEKNQNQLKVHNPPSIGTMHTDFTKLRQILFNLLSNAAKFTNEGTITLEIKEIKKQHTDWVQFLVADTGIGIDAKYISNLFEPFNQADSSTTRQFGGTGLGLSISRHFCQILGGNITVTSVLGEGASFIVQLPRQPIDSSN